jgi:hypothetical protein
MWLCKHVSNLSGLLLLSLLVAGCGYQFRASGEPMGIQVENLAIPLFTSTSSEIGFEADFTRVIRDEFISHARVPLVPEERAEMVIEGRVYSIGTAPLTYNSRNFTVNGLSANNDVTSSRNLRIILDVRLVDKKQGKVLWHDGSMTESASYAVDADPLVTRYNQNIALETIASRMAKRIYLKTMERF